MEAKGDFLKSEFWALGWVHSTDKTWWARMVGFILEELREPLVQSGLYQAVRAIQYGISPGYFHFFARLERYNSDSCTFFTPNGKWGLHCTNWMKSLVYWWRICHMKNTSPAQKKDALQVYETYWSVVLLLHLRLNHRTKGWRSEADNLGKLIVPGFE